VLLTAAGIDIRGVAVCDVNFSDSHEFHRYFEKIVCLNTHLIINILDFFAIVLLYVHLCSKIYAKIMMIMMTIDDDLCWNYEIEDCSNTQ